MNPMELPKVSVVTVVRNSARTLQEAIDSAHRQDYPRLEHLVIDGGSTDGTLDIIRGNAARLASWTSEPDGGIYDAMNKGVARATGDWVVFLNADDAFYDAGAVRAVFAGAGPALEGKLVVYGDSMLRFDHGPPRLRRSKPLRALRFKMPFSHQGAFVRTELLRRRPFDTHFRLAGDYDFFRDVYARYGDGAFLSSPVCVNYFRVGGATYRDMDARHREVIEIIRRYEKGLACAYWHSHYVARYVLRDRLLGYARRLRRWAGGDKGTLD